MKCKDCKKEVLCPLHGDRGLNEFQHEDDGSWYYYCSDCLDEGSGAFGSIVHWCKDMFGLFSQNVQKENNQEEKLGKRASQTNCSPVKNISNLPDMLNLNKAKLGDKK